MKIFCTLLLTLATLLLVKAQVYIGLNGETIPIHPSAMLQLEASAKGFLLPAISNPAGTITVINTPSAEGLTVYDQGASKSLSFYRSDHKWETIKSSATSQYNIFPSQQLINNPANGTLYQQNYAHTITFTITKKSLVELNPDSITRESLSGSTRYNFFSIQQFTLRKSDGTILQTLNMKNRAINVQDNFSGSYQQRVWISRILDPGTYYLRLDFGHQRGSGTSFVDNIGTHSVTSTDSGSIIITEVD